MNTRSRNTQQKLRGFSLVELLTAIGVFGMIAFSIAVFAIDSQRASTNSDYRTKSLLFLQEMANAGELMRDETWTNIVALTDAGPQHFVFANNQYEVAPGVTTSDGITLSFTVTQTLRDASGNIVPSGGTVDIHTRTVTFSASWTDVLGQANMVQNVIYLNDWTTGSWRQTTAADFNAGSSFFTFVTNNFGGEVELDSVIYPDWCNPSLTLNAYNIPGSATAKTITAVAQPDGSVEAFLGSGGSTSGVDLTHVTVNGIDPPSVTVDGTFDSNYLVNDIEADTTYAYLATDSNTKEVVILNITNPAAMVEVGYYNAPDTTDAEAVAVTATAGFVAQGRRLRSFNLASKTGSRPSLDTLDVGIYGSFITEIQIIGNYAFVTLDNDWDEVVVVDISNPSDMFERGIGDVNFQQSQDLFVTLDSNFVYLGTDAVSNARELFVLNSSNKGPPYTPTVTPTPFPKLAEAESNGMSIRGITAIENVVIIGGVNGEEYQVFYVVESGGNYSLNKCGGLQVNSGVNDIASITDIEGNVFSYIMTNDTSSELKIVRGGPGGGGGGGLGYATTGTFTSPVFDTGSSTRRFISLDWGSTVPATTTLRLQLRAGNSANLSAVSWKGPDGTSSTYFTGTGGVYLSTMLDNNRYIQFRALLDGDGTATPILDEVIINYE